MILGSSGRPFGIIWPAFWDHLAVILGSSGSHLRLLSVCFLGIPPVVLFFVGVLVVGLGVFVSHHHHTIRCRFGSSHFFVGATVRLESLFRGRYCHEVWEMDAAV